jgi:hypothetical protein
MKINFASPTKEPTLECLSQIMKEVAEEAKLQEEFAKRSILEAIDREFAIVQKKIALRK